MMKANKSKLRRLKTAGLLFVLLFIIAEQALGSWIEGTADILSAWDQIANKYFYAAMALWPAMLMGIGKLRQGERLSPPMAKATAFTMKSINIVCLSLLIIHFSPETSTVFDFITSVFDRIF